MAKESLKAREVKRAHLVEKYAEKRAKLKAEGDFVGLQKLPKIRHVFVCTTVASLQAAPRDICASLESAGSISGRWHLSV
jgi:hypothetical protein